MNKNKKELEILLYNLRSVHNVGSIFRTADAVAVSKIYLFGTSPAPIDRFGRKRKDLSKVALGAEDFIPWEQVENLKEFISQKKAVGFKVAALEQDKNSKDFREMCKEEKLLLILGNEPEGLDQEVLSLVDVVYEIPMLGKKESLNVSVAFGVAAYQFRCEK